MYETKSLENCLRRWWYEAHYSSISSQTTIYGLTKLSSDGPTIKFLIASIESGFFSFEYQKNGDEIFIPLLRKLLFENVPQPGECDVIAIDSFERCFPRTGFVIAITYVIDDDPVIRSAVLNIYALHQDECDGDKEYDVETIAGHCYSLPLTYVPIALTHTQITTGGRLNEGVFLVTGSDLCVHVFRESGDQGGEQGGVEEVSCKCSFPELVGHCWPIIQIDIVRLSGQCRLTAVGLSNGMVKLFHVDESTVEVINTWDHKRLFTITSLRFFTHNNVARRPSFLPDARSNPTSRCPSLDTDNSTADINLVCMSAEENGIVFRDVLTNGLSVSAVLPDSAAFDVPMCSLAIDMDFDGQQEILVGTYGQELLLYKYLPTPSIPSSSSEAAELTRAGLSPPPSGLSPFLGKACCLAAGNVRRLTDELSRDRHRSADHMNLESVQRLGDRHCHHQQRKVRSQDDLMLLVRQSGQDSLCQPYGEANPQVDGDAEPVKPQSDSGYRLVWRRSLKDPVCCLGSGDLLGDGVENLFILSLFGMHVMQPDTAAVMDILLHRMKTLCGDDTREMVTEGPVMTNEKRKGAE